MTYKDSELAQEIQRLKDAIQKWAERHDLWFDCCFVDYLTHVNGEPGSPAVVAILCPGSELSRVIDEDFEVDGEPFHEFVASLGYECENQNGYNLYLYAKDDGLNAAFESYFHWQWVCSLIQPDVGDVYEELFSHFIANPDDLRRLTPRAFEVLLYRVFQNQGFTAELGPGSGDGGVDIRLWQRDPLGDVLTLVQAKRYAAHRKIKLDAVAALRGVMAVEKAPKGIFVTTSTYLPSARRFAGREANTIDLATTVDVVNWCANATDGIVKDKSTLVSKASIENLLLQIGTSHDKRILHSSGGYNMVINYFAIVLKETKYAALLMSLPRSVLSDDGHGQRGTEIPSLGLDALKRHNKETVWRAMRKVNEHGTVSYWDGKRLYFVWNGIPVHFDYMD
ncbi:MAG: restriction endonuclease [Burkholderiaceae bacterium]|nr:restriction endonuclease [Burkholderiaceae bacterium]